jgi:predicted nucleic acid-binding Zn finger protein
MVKQLIENRYQQQHLRDRRSARGMVVAFSCEIVAIDDQKGTYKIQSEIDVNKYYLVKFIDGTPVHCSCKDFEIQIKRNEKHLCKHMRSIVIAENYGLVTKQQQQSLTQAMIKKKKRTKEMTSVIKSSYKDDDYSF